MGRKVSIRVIEHLVHMQKAETTKSISPEYVWDNSHRFLFEKFSVPSSKNSSTKWNLKAADFVKSNKAILVPSFTIPDIHLF